MIRRVVSFALNQPLFLLLMVALFVGGGVLAFKSLPIEAFPDVSDIQVNVVTLYPGRAAEEVEKQVTIPLELSLAGLPNSVRMFSHTQFGLSYIMLTFDDGATSYFARQQVLERLQTADLPNGIVPQLAPLSTPIGEIYRYRMRGAGLSPTDLRTLQDWTVTRYLKMTPGVADVVTIGGLVKQYEVNPDLERLRYYDLSLLQVYNALGRGNANAGGSYVEQGSQQYLVRGIGLLRSADDIGNVVVASRGGTPILIKDVARVTVSGLPRQGLVGQDRDDDVVTGIVLMRKVENPSEVLRALKQRVSELNASVLPKGVTVEPFYDRTWLIDTTLHTVFDNLAEGALLVTLVLLLFLGNFRAAAIVAAVIPLSLLATFIGLTWRGIPANLLSLGAMDFGIIVDGAVIVVENVFRKLSEAGRRRDGAALRDAAPLRDATLEATVEVGRPTFFSMLIIIAANIPIFTLQRHEGRIFAPMAWTVTSALIGSLLLSLTLVPLLCYFLLRSRLPHEENRLVKSCKRVYEPVLQWAMRSPRRVVAAAVIALVASVACAPRLGTEFLPELNEGTIWINFNLPPGISIAETMVQVRRARLALLRIPEVTTVISKAGRPEDGTDPKPLNMVEIFVGVQPPSEWKRHVTKDQIIREMDEALAPIPGIEVSFSQPIRDNVLESISQIDGQVVVKVFGDDPDTLRQTTTRILAQLDGVPGVERAFVDRAGAVPQARLEIDRARAARYGLNVSDLEDQIEIGLGGRPATELWEGERHFSVVARLADNDRQLAALERIPIDVADGVRIPLSEVAHVTTASGAMNISRENGRRVMAVGVFIHGRDMGSVVKDMQSRVSKLALPNGYTISWSGEFENQQRAMRRLTLIVPISVFLIFVLLFHTFGSVRYTLLVLLNVPFAMIGGILALLITGIPLSVSAAIGFIALFGQAVLNGVVMISVFNQMRAAGADAEDAVRDGSLLRMRTVLMTAALAMLGLLPMALSHGIGSETQRPLAVVIIGGLITATVLVLVVLPALYLALARRESRPGVLRPRRPTVERVAAWVPALLLCAVLASCVSPGVPPLVGAPPRTQPAYVVGRWVAAFATDSGAARADLVLSANALLWDELYPDERALTDVVAESHPLVTESWWWVYAADSKNPARLCLHWQAKKHGAECLPFSIDSTDAHGASRLTWGRCAFVREAAEASPTEPPARARRAPDLKRYCDVRQGTQAAQAPQAP